MSESNKSNESENCPVSILFEVGALRERSPCSRDKAAMSIPPRGKNPYLTEHAAGEKLRHVSELETPAVVIDYDIVTKNADKMIKIAADRGVALRPHAKTHKTLGVCMGAFYY